MLYVKNKRGTEGSRERNIHHANAKKVLLQIFGAAKHFVPNNWEGESESTTYTDIQSEYIGNWSKIKLLEASIMAYDTRDPLIITTPVDDYAGAVEDLWGNRATTGVYLLSQW